MKDKGKKKRTKKGERIKEKFPEKVPNLKKPIERLNQLVPRGNQTSGCCFMRGVNVFGSSFHQVRPELVYIR